MSLTAFQTFALLSLLPAAEPSAETALPPGAVVRFGSTRFLYNGWLSDVAYSPDGRTLITGAVGKSGPHEGKSQLVFWDAATGERRYESALEVGQVYNVVPSPDGSTIATYFSGQRQFILFDAANGKLLRKVGARVLGSPTFSPDSKRLAGIVGNEIHVWEVATGEELLRLDGHRQSITWVSYSPDGRQLASVGRDNSMRLWDLATGEILLQQEDEERRWSFVDFTTDGRSVGATVVARGDEKACQLIFWDVVGGAETLRVPVATDVQGFLFSADGKTLVLIETNAAEVREAATGKLVRRFRLGAPTQSRSWTITRDGRFLAAGGSGCVVHQWNLTTGELKDGQPGHRYPIQSVAVAADGLTVLTQDNAGDVRLWNPATGRELRRFKAPSDAIPGLPFAPNGRAPYYCCLAPENVLRLVEGETGRERSRIKFSAGEMRSLATTADGALLATMVVDGEGVMDVSVWESAAGKKRKGMEKPSSELVTLALSADGTRLAGGSSDAIQVWEVATGREVRHIPLDKELRLQTLRFSADGRRLLAVGQETNLGVWETDTGRRVMFTNVEGTGIYSAALSPDGRTVAVTLLQNGAEPYTTVLLEVASGEERWRFTGHYRSEVNHFVFTPHALAFTPDGRSLITVGADSTALVWSLPFRGDNHVIPRRAELAPLWNDLADTKAVKSYSALAALVAAPELAVPFLQERLRPVPVLNEKARAEIARRLADLDSEEFETRENAAAALERLEELAAPALRKSMAAETSAEMRRHLTRLLERLDVHPPSPEVLRTIRVVETLERIATPEARKVLEEIAKGAPESGRTREAREAIARLRQRGQQPK